jgi:hypothetical protein
MAATNFSGPIIDHDGDTALPGNLVAVQKTVPVTIVDGAAAGTFRLPLGTFVQHIWLETPVTIPGTPTNTNLRLGSAANGQQYVADVDVKTAGLIPATIVLAGRRASGVVHFTVASSGGTAASQDGTVNIIVAYAYTA